MLNHDLTAAPTEPAARQRVVGGRLVLRRRKIVHPSILQRQNPGDQPGVLKMNWIPTPPKRLAGFELAGIFLRSRSDGHDSVPAGGILSTGRCRVNRTLAQKAIGCYGPRERRSGMVAGKLETDEIIKVKVALEAGTHSEFKIFCIRQGVTMDAWLRARVEEAVEGQSS